MKKIYLIIIMMVILLTGCMMGSEKSVEALEPEYALESAPVMGAAPIMETEMVEEVLQKMDIPNFTKSDWATSAFNISSANLVGAKVTIFVPEENRDEAAKLIEELLGKK